MDMNGIFLKKSSVNSTIFFSLYILFIIALPLNLSAQGLAYQPYNSNNLNKITVIGDAEVHVEPDILIVRLGVKTADNDPLKAMKSKNNIISEVINIAGKHGIKKKNIRTEYTNFEQDFYENRRQHKDFWVRDMLEISIENPDPEKFENFILEAVDAGVTSILGIDFKCTDLQKYRNEARKLAMVNARNRAESLVQTEPSVKIGKPISISESYNRYWPSYSSWWRGHDSSQFYTSQIAVPYQSESSENSSQSPGKIRVSSQVNVSYELLYE